MLHGISGAYLSTRGGHVADTRIVGIKVVNLTERSGPVKRRTIKQNMVNGLLCAALIT